jgi:hypothetical protein
MRERKTCTACGEKPAQRDGLCVFCVIAGDPSLYQLAHSRVHAVSAMKLAERVHERAGSGGLTTDDLRELVANWPEVSVVAAAFAVHGDCLGSRADFALDGAVFTLRVNCGRVELSRPGAASPLLVLGDDAAHCLPLEEEVA